VKPDASADLKKKRDAVIATIYDADADMLFHFDELGKLFNKQIVLLEEKVRLIGERNVCDAKLNVEPKPSYKGIFFKIRLV
jgi:hypothetical protein